MSYSDVLTGLHERFATVTGIAVLLDYEPTAIHTTPTLYSLLDRAEYRTQGQLNPTFYRVLHRLVFQWQDSEQAERQLVPYVDAVPAAVRADPQLGGRIMRGMSRITDCQGVFVSIGGVLYRCLDFYSETIVK